MFGLDAENFLDCVFVGVLHVQGKFASGGDGAIEFCDQICGFVVETQVSVFAHLNGAIIARAAACQQEREQADGRESERAVKNRHDHQNL